MITPKFSTLGSIKQISRQDPLNSFPPNDSLRDLLGFDIVTLNEENNLSPNPVVILSFDNNFLECDIALGMIFRRRGSGIIHNLTMDVSPGFKYMKSSEEVYNVM